MQISVSKYHGCGNDFIIAREADAEGIDREALVRAACGRHLGIGADGMILVREQPLEMLYYNQDGSRAPMCGNGIRCFSAFCYDEGICTDKEFTVQTLAGKKQVKRLGDAPFLAEIGMGQPDYAPQKLELREEVLRALKEAEEKQPAALGQAEKKPDSSAPCVSEQSSSAAGESDALAVYPQVNAAQHAGRPEGAAVWGLPISVSVCGRTVTCVIYSFYMSTIHTVLFVKDAFAEENEALGRAICHHPLFRAQTNVNFAEYVDRGHLRMQTYERGCGMTLACGTGACASAVCAHRLGLCDSETTEVLLRCGKLRIGIDAKEQVSMTGPAKRVMKGTFFFDDKA